MIQLLKAIWLPVTITLLSLIGVIFTKFWMIFGVAAILFACDSIGRFADYIYLKTAYREKKHLLYWGLFSHTRCSRNVMIAIDPRSRDFYKVLGYKWYHFLPDKNYRLNKNWLTLYRPKYKTK